MTVRRLLIVNPRSANRSTGRLWPKIEERLRALLGPFDAVQTRASGDAARLASEAVGRYEVVVAVGGDGTAGEVVNGLVGKDGSVPPGVALGLIPRGTGRDLVRSLGVPVSLNDAAAVLVRDQRREVDVGRAEFRGPDGMKAVRYFINAAEVGAGAAVSEAVNRASRRLSGPAAFWWAILVAALRYRERQVSISVEGSPPRTVRLTNAWIANGRYSGGGILSAPRAALDDGLLDVVSVGHLSPLRRLRGLFKLRTGAFVDMPEVDYRQARRVEFAAAAPVPVETDGDPVGALPGAFELLPSRLPVVC